MTQSDLTWLHLYLTLSSCCYKFYWESYNEVLETQRQDKFTYLICKIKFSSKEIFNAFKVMPNYISSESLAKSILDCTVKFTPT